MYKLTKRREAKALPVLKQAYESLVLIDLGIRIGMSSGRSL